MGEAGEKGGPHFSCPDQQGLRQIPAQQAHQSCLSPTCQARALAVELLGVWAAWLRTPPPPPPPRRRGSSQLLATTGSFPTSGRGAGWGP